MHGSVNTPLGTGPCSFTSICGILLGFPHPLPVCCPFGNGVESDACAPILLKASLNTSVSVISLQAGSLFSGSLPRAAPARWGGSRELVIRILLATQTPVIGYIITIAYVIRSEFLAYTPYVPFRFDFFDAFGR